MEPNADAAARRTLASELSERNISRCEALCTDHVTMCLLYCDMSRKVDSAKVFAYPKGSFSSTSLIQIVHPRALSRSALVCVLQGS